MKDAGRPSVQLQRYGYYRNWEPGVREPASSVPGQYPFARSGNIPRPLLSQTGLLRRQKGPAAMRWGHSELEPAGSVVLSVRNEGKPPNTSERNSSGPSGRPGDPPHPGTRGPVPAVDAPKAEIEQVPPTGATAHRRWKGWNYGAEADNSASQPRRKTRTYCHTGFVYKSLRQGPPHAPLRIRRKNGDIRRLIAPVAKLDPSRVKMETYSPADPVLISRAHMRPLKRAEKRGRGGKILPAPMAGKTAKSRAENPGTETQRSPVSSPEYIMTSWRMSTSRPSSMAIIMSSASAIILA